MADIVRKVRPKSIGQGFRNDFINDIAKDNRSIILRCCGLILFRNKSDISMIYFRRNISVRIKFSYQLVDILFNPTLSRALGPKVAGPRLRSS